VTSRISIMSMFCITIWFANTTASAQNLRDAVLIALAQYPSILAAQANAASATADIDRASAQHWPQIGWQGTQSTYSQVSPNLFAPGNTWIQSPTVNVNLWSGWRIQSEVERAKALADVGNFQTFITQDEVALIVSETYLNWARLLSLIHLAELNVKAHQRIENDIRKIVNIDSGRRIDSEQAQVRLENALLLLEQRQAELAIIEARLRRMLLGKMPAQPTGINQEVGTIPSEVQQALSAINNEHPRIAEQLSQIEASKAQIRSAQSQYSPTVNLSYGKQTNQGTGQGDYVTQLNVAIPIFSGGATKAAMASAQAQLSAAQYRLEEARLTQRERLMAAWSEWVSARKRISMSKRQSEQGAAIVSGYEKQFRIGRRSLLDLLNVQNDLYNYQTSSVNADFDALVARTRIVASMGKLASAYRAVN